MCIILHTTNQASFFTNKKLNKIKFYFLIILSGVGIDLVCLGEQPLHAVPLIKFISSKSKNSSEDTYNVPQWINLSYYSKPNSKSSVFVPRMTVPEKPQPEEICMLFIFTFTQSLTFILITQAMLCFA